MFSRLTRFWVYGGALSGLLLFAVTPLLAHNWPLWQLSVWLLLPVYMVHQWEEHDEDRFRRFVNTEVGRGRDALSPLAVFIINVPGVWGVIALAWALALEVRPGLGLIAVYMVLVNALAHVAAFLVMRRYNPGLISAAVLFLPVGLWSLNTLVHAGATAGDQAIGLATAILMHAAILGWVRLRATAPS
jgi:hypothetical protein